MEIKAITIILLSVCAIAQTAPALHSQVISAVKHPDNNKAVLAILEDGQFGEVFLENSTFNLLINATPGHRDGPLDTSQFNMATAIMWLSEDRYAISDMLNHCIREVQWSDKTVQGLAGSCNEEASSLKNPRHMVRDARKSDIIYVSGCTDNAGALYKIDLAVVHSMPTEPSVTHNLNAASPNDAHIQPLADSQWCVLGLAMSEAQNILYMLTRDMGTPLIALTSVDTGAFALKASRHIVTTADRSRITDGSPGRVYAPQEIDVRHCALLQVGDHLLVVLGKGSPIVDFHFGYNPEGFEQYSLETKHTSLQNAKVTEHGYDFNQSIGPAIYIDNPADPERMYTWYDGSFKPFDHIDRYQLKSQTRPSYWTSSWIKTQGYKCPYADECRTYVHDLTLHGDDVCEMKTCYSECEKICDAADNCVAFQCNSKNQGCSIYNCTAAPTELSRKHSCYRMVDVVYAPPIL